MPLFVRRFAACCLCSAFISYVAAGAQAPAPHEARWSVEELHGPPVALRFTTDEGTWMSLDVSPDGETIVFDLLGDLYSLPIAGGTATRITGGAAWDAAPRFSPDGRRIVFSSDRSGSDQLWLAGPDGSSPKQMTSDAVHQYSVPSWLPDGRFVLATRTTNSAEPWGAFITLLHVGGGTGAAIVEGQGFGPAASADGRWVYYSVYDYRGRAAAVLRLDLRTGEKTTVVAGYDDAFRPAPSRSGRQLAFGALIDGQRVLVVRDLETGRDRVLFRGLDTVRYSHDDLDRLPGYAFTPDDKAIVFSADGKIRRADLASGVVTIVPFTALVDQTLTEKVYARGRIKDDAIKLKALHWTQPVGTGRVIFGAAGKLYIYDAATQRATPFGDGPGLQYVPAVSPAGEWVAYVTGTDTVGCHILKARVSGGEPVQLTRRPGHYQSISWSADGKRLVIAEEARDLDQLGAIGYKLHWLDAQRPGDLHWIADVKPRGERKAVPKPVFDQSGARIYYSEPNAGAWELWSMGLRGEEKRRLAKSKLADEMVPSPDGKWLAFTERQDVYLAALPPGGKDGIDVYRRGAPFATYRMSTEGGDYIYWLDGGKTLGWSWGPKFSTIDLATATSGESVTPQTLTVSLELPRAQGKGLLLLKNARLLTMRGDEVIERGDILIVNGRIAAIGRSGQVRASAAAAQIDLSGKTIMPGLIDLHAHYEPAGPTGTDVYPEQNPELVANLAYGVTTWRDPSSRSQTLFGLAELVETGRTLGPRIFSTGDLLFALEYICCGQAESLDEARAFVLRQKALGATSIKEHTQPRREQVQWMIQACREEGLMAVMDPARGPRRELRTIMDGATSLEHLYAPSPVKKDVVSVLARTGAFYVPTVFIAEMSYYLTSIKLHDDPKLRRFIPHVRLDRQIHQSNQWKMPHERMVARYAKDILAIVRGGGKVGMGTHGQIQGLSAHFELWMMASGGLTPHEAIRAGTLVGAEALGFQEDLGSLEVGKLADLIVLNENPLVDLKHTNTIIYVMKGGVMWNADTMDEVWPTKRKRPGVAWEESQP